MNESQQRAWQRHAAEWVVEVEQHETSTSVAEQPPLDLGTLFGRTAPLLVEIGSGTGDSLVPMAAARPDWNVLAFEVFQPAVASTLGKLAAAGVGNVRLLMHDAVGGLTHLLTPASVDEVWTFFPDPWHKTRHHKRRLVSPEFAGLVASRLTDTGTWRLATDWDDYAEWMREVLDVAPGLVNVHAGDGGWAPRFADRPVTRFESRGLAAGRTIRDLTYRRAESGTATP